MIQEISNILFDFFHFLIVLIKGVNLELESRYSDPVTSILKQLQCRILFFLKANNDK